MDLPAAVGNPELGDDLGKCVWEVGGKAEGEGQGGTA